MTTRSRHKKDYESVSPITKDNHWMRGERLKIRKRDQLQIQREQNKLHKGR